MNFIKQLFTCSCWSCDVTCRWWKAYREPKVDQHQSCVFRRREQHLITRNYCPLVSVGVGNTLLWCCDGADSGPGNATWIEGGSWNATTGYKHKADFQICKDLLEETQAQPVGSGFCRCSSMTWTSSKMYRGFYKLAVSTIRRVYRA